MGKDGQLTGYASGLDRKRCSYTMKNYLEGEVKSMYAFVEYPKCSICRKAKSELDGLQCEFQSQNIVTETPIAKLQEWMAASGLPIKSFFNISGMKYRGTRFEDKVDQLTVKSGGSPFFRWYADQAASPCQRRKSCSSGLPETVRRLRFVKKRELDFLQIYKSMPEAFLR